MKTTLSDFTCQKQLLRRKCRAQLFGYFPSNMRALESANSENNVAGSFVGVLQGGEMMSPDSSLLFLRLLRGLRLALSWQTTSAVTPAVNQSQRVCLVIPHYYTSFVGLAPRHLKEETSRRPMLRASTDSFASGGKTSHCAGKYLEAPSHGPLAIREDHPELALDSTLASTDSEEPEQMILLFRDHGIREVVATEWMVHVRARTIHVCASTMARHTSPREYDVGVVADALGVESAPTFPRRPPPSVALLEIFVLEVDSRGGRKLSQGS
ncbi:hypothetical protein R3P38DRAFT_2814432 [Favolaschia claudopus]|uniref:Uncharacterized protein n=1 Tax=Favolaschia claudopus TaxID=2862362 RepID=A0AAV9Z303_9AGAR